MNITYLSCDSNCHSFFKFTSSCPLNQINLNENFNFNDLNEIMMVILSIAPYPTGIAIIFYAIFYKTSRSLFISGLLLAQVKQIKF